MSRRTLFCFASGLLYVLLCWLLGSAYPVLDEESYLYIAEQLEFARPYDWPLPWHPWDDTYIYAHPPLFLWWVKIGYVVLGKNIVLLKLFLGMPWQLLFGASVAYLGLRFSPYPLGVVGLWLAAPVVVLTGSRALMPDLQVCALATAAMACYLQARQSDANWHYVRAGLMLGLACWTKYPALLLWVVLLVDAKNGRQLGLLLLGFGMVFLAGEAWLWWQYGRVHLLEVMLHAPDIARGSLSGRTLGILMRILVAMPFLVLTIRWQPKFMVFALVIGFLFVFLANPVVGKGGWLLAVFCACFASFAMIGALQKIALFELWASVVIIGVIAVHNFAAPRYLLLATVPLVLSIRCSPKVVWGVVVVSFGVTIGLSQAEKLFAAESVQLARRLSAGQPKGFFLGEWSFRWAMREQGWKVWKQEPDGLLAQPKHSISGGIPQNRLLLTQQYGTDVYFRLLHSQASIGYYSETLGFWPVGWVSGPVEEVRLWKP